MHILENSHTLPSQLNNFQNLQPILALNPNSPKLSRIRLLIFRAFKVEYLTKLFPGSLLLKVEITLS